MKSAHIIIMAAGRGKRMNSELPKVLVPLHDKPLIVHLLDRIKESSVYEKPIIVVGYGKDLVMKTLGEEYFYAVQEELLGTAHAVLSAKPIIENTKENIIVLNGDQPFTSAETLTRLLSAHLESGDVLTMGTVEVQDFLDWRAGFFDFGRIIRDENGIIIDIVEKKDATEEQLAIHELNINLFCFNTEWLWENLKKLKNENAQGEYYLTSLISLAKETGTRINSIVIDPIEALGVNTKEHLELLENLLSENL